MKSLEVDFFLKQDTKLLKLEVRLLTLTWNNGISTGAAFHDGLLPMMYKEPLQITVPNGAAENLIKREAGDS